MQILEESLYGLSPERAVKDFKGQEQCDEKSPFQTSEGCAQNLNEELSRYAGLGAGGGTGEKEQESPENQELVTEGLATIHSKEFVFDPHRDGKSWGKC